MLAAHRRAARLPLRLSDVRGRLREVVDAHGGRQLLARWHQLASGDARVGPPRARVGVALLEHEADRYGVATLDECKRLCASIDGCEFISYANDAGGNGCYIRKTNGQLYPSACDATATDDPLPGCARVRQVHDHAADPEPRLLAARQHAPPHALVGALLHRREHAAPGAAHRHGAREPERARLPRLPGLHGALRGGNDATYAETVAVAAMRIDRGKLRASTSSASPTGAPRTRARAWKSRPTSTGTTKWWETCTCSSRRRHRRSHPLRVGGAWPSSCASTTPVL